MNKPVFTAGNGVENDASMEIGRAADARCQWTGVRQLRPVYPERRTVSGSAPATNDFGGTMVAHGIVNSVFTNLGQFTVDGTLRFNGGATNSGIFQGSGTVIGAFTNSAGGAIQIGAGVQLGISGAWTNTGLVTLAATRRATAPFSVAARSPTPARSRDRRHHSPVVNTAGVVRASGGELDLAGPNNTTPWQRKSRSPSATPSSICKASRRTPHHRSLGRHVRQ